MTIKSILAGAAVALGLSTAAFAADVKVGFVYVGPTGDHGWTYRHDIGRQQVEEAFGDRVETTFVESVGEGADAERVFTQMALQGHDIIFGTSFGYMDPMENVAKKFPDVKFEHQQVISKGPTLPITASACTKPGTCRA
jgi:simple sugar transport system substrate-binding protein